MPAKVNKTAKTVDKPKATVNKKAAPKKALAKKPATKKKPAPKKPVVTEAMHEKWFFDMPADYFVQMCMEWNERNLRLKIPKKEGYDQWLNYFKGLSPNAIKLLAVSGQDILTTEAYTALRRWYDIISNPHRIEKIHQSGLTSAPANKKAKTIVQLAANNDRLGVLCATRDRIAEKLEKGAGARDTAALAREMTEIMTQIADYEKRMGPKKDTLLGQLLDDMPGVKRKRPSQNGGGARHTSFKSRVTIRDIEDKE